MKRLILVSMLMAGCASGGLAFGPPVSTPEDRFFATLDIYNGAAAVAEVIEDAPGTDPKVAQKIDDVQAQAAKAVSDLMQNPPPAGANEWETASALLTRLAAELQAYQGGK